MKIKILFITLTILIITPALHAATMIEMKSEGEISRIYSDGKMARMEMPGGEGYMVINSGTGDSYAVMPDKRMVIRMSSSTEGTRAPSNRYRTRFKKAGRGPEIAGYKTTRIDFFAGDIPCGTSYTSKAALKDSKMENVFKVIHKMASKAQSVSRQYNMHNDPCEEVDSSMIEKVKELGMPLRSLSKDGSLENEVIRIDNNAKLPPKVFYIPKEYEVQDMDEMQRSPQQEMHQNRPDNERMLRQMEESGNLPPEMMEKLRRAQEMMRQQQR